MSNYLGSLGIAAALGAFAGGAAGTWSGPAGIALGATSGVLAGLQGGSMWWQGAMKDRWDQHQELQVPVRDGYSLLDQIPGGQSFELSDQILAEHGMTMREGVASHNSFLRGHTFNPGGFRRILLVHGFSSSRGQFRRLIPELLQFCPEVRIDAVDLPGCGRSDLVMDGDYSFSHTGQVLLAFLKATGARDTVVVGASMGGAVTVSLLESLKPDEQALIGGAVLIAPLLGDGTPFKISPLIRRMAKSGTRRPFGRRWFEELLQQLVCWVLVAEDPGLFPPNVVNNLASPYFRGKSPNAELAVNARAAMAREIVAVADGRVKVPNDPDWVSPRRKLRILTGGRDAMLRDQIGILPWAEKTSLPEGSHILDWENPVWVAERITSVARDVWEGPQQ